MMWQAISARSHRLVFVPEPAPDLNVVAQVETERSLSYFHVKRLAPGTFNSGFIVSTCTALP